MNRHSHSYETEPSWMLESLYGVVPMELLRSTVPVSVESIDPEFEQSMASTLEDGANKQSTFNLDWLSVFF